MQLSEHIKRNPGAGTRIARELGVSLSYLSQMASGHRPIPVKTAVRIEVLTDGAVPRWDMHPDDWHRIWPELIDAPGAPAVPAEGERQERAA
jgi:DNA-binding transcriptional regulator YdaS (Cro superfamily)